MTDKIYEAIIGSKDADRLNSIRNLNATRDIAALIMLDNAICSKQCNISELMAAGNFVASDYELENLSIQITFDKYSAAVPLNCLDTYDAFRSFIEVAIYNLELYGLDK